MRDKYYLSVVVKQLGEGGAVLGRIKDQDQFAEVGGVLNVLLLQNRFCVHCLYTCTLDCITCLSK